MAKKDVEPEKVDTVESRLANLIDKVSSEVGKNSIKLVSAGFERRPCAPFGIPSVDHLLNGGIPEGTIVDVFGAPGSGKSTICLHLLANQVKRNKIALIVDAEHKLDPMLAKTIGLDMSKHPYSQPETAEEAFDIIFAAANNMSAGDVILVDSAAALVPKAVIDGDMEQKFMGGNSIVMSQGIKKVLHAVSTHGVILLFINQIRQKIGVFYGPTTDTPCGMALKFHANARIEVTKGQLIQRDNLNVGQMVTVKTIKTSHCAPFQSVVVPLYFGTGFDILQSEIDLALSQGIIVQAGAWYSYGEHKWQGVSNVYDTLKGNETLRQEIVSKLTI